MKKRCMGYSKSVPVRWRGKKRGPNPRPYRSRPIRKTKLIRPFFFKNEEARERSLMRHGWYRKKKFHDTLRAKPGQHHA